MTSLPSRFVEANGLRIHYVRAGKGRPVVLLHGWPEFWLTWRKNIPALSRRFDVIAPDLRHFGRTRPAPPAPPVPLTPELLAEDLHALLTALDIERVGLVSHDIGAFAAQSFARRWPERLIGLFFFNCPYPGIGKRWAEADQLPETWYQYFNQQPWAAELVGRDRESCRIYIGHFLRHWVQDPAAFEEDIEAWVDNFMRPGALDGGFAWYRGIDRARREMIRHGPPRLPPIDTPTRVCWGEADPVLRASWTDRLGDYFSTIEIKTVPAAGHFVHYERPELANSEIADFFAALD